MGSDRRIPAAECTEYPWWVIIDPDVIHGLFGKDQRAGRVAAAVTGPFLSRAEAQAQLGRRRYAYGPDAVVYSLSGHDSSDWRALCHEDPVERDALRSRAEAAEQRAEALAAELEQARADQAEASGFLAECHKQLDELEGILSDTLAARARAEAEAERLRSAIAETLRLADIYAGVAAHNAEAEPETAGEAWRSAGAATVRELRRALGGAA